MTTTGKTSNEAVKTNAANTQPADSAVRATITQLENMLDAIETILAEIKSDIPDEALTSAERKRLLGSGVRRYGFIDKVSDVSETSPEFAPKYFSSTELKNKIRKLEVLRNITVVLQKILRIIDDALLKESDSTFQMSLGYYNAVREASRRKQPGALAVYKALQLFFHRTRSHGEEPTEPEIERDMRALLHGKKDGKIVIENERPHMVGGKHVVVDETNKPKGAWKATEEGEID
jgi:hypothetical protein